MIYVEGAKPALLTHGDCDKEADLDDLRLREMFVQLVPEGIVCFQVPCDSLSIGERGLLSVIVKLGIFEIQKVLVVLFD